MSTTCTPVRNNPLRASLPPGIAEIPAVHLEAVVSPVLDGACSEVAVVGSEGVVGECAYMGGGKALSSARARCPGQAGRMDARDIAEPARDHGPVMQLLLRYTQALFTPVAQSSACNCHHALGPRCAAGCCSTWTGRPAMTCASRMPWGLRRDAGRSGAGLGDSPRAHARWRHG